MTERYTKTASGCWVWNGSVVGCGYGVLSFFKRNVYVHRLSYRLFKGEVKPHLYVLHRCDNPPCFNPDHLFVGTAKDNIEDMIKKGRSRFRQVGDPPTNSKFTDDTVEKIRKDHAAGITPQELRAIYSISHAQLWRITSNRSRTKCIRK